MSKTPTAQPAADQRLRPVAEGLWVVDHPMVLGGGFQLPTRMTVLRLGGDDQELMAYSPVPLSEATALEIEAQGSLRWIVAPNLFHHFYVGGVQQRFPQAKTLGAVGLPEKRGDLQFDGELGAGPTEPFTDESGPLRRVFVAGAPTMNESVLFHEPSSTLVVADLLFNMVRPQGLMAHTVLRLMGVHGRLGQSRAWRLFFSKDRAALRSSCQQIVALPFERVVPCHGDVFEGGAPARAQQAVGQALRWMLGR